ncbi:hydantoinase B/oxoprolinase family protein [Maritimibacter sp. DP07]|uniref:Hydantoinase B/oxoprolinase family protein n=1 Tax=Maritimibacter harenae TaxID=2606218 RepID=A0A845M2I5_9RHOB|nr:hydantoinase B/oxoprolinase family protein [Maritimibacter harenae]MZR14560.1 hydantoinase B/oxoprolinase family protein [Maritimibacter harenae]
MSENDPITLEIIQNSLQAAADEMFAAMRKTAMSSIIYEVLDMGTGITDAEGRIASSGAGIPAFIGVLDKSVQFILSKHDDIRPGDVFITNDPWHGGVTHLNDLVLAMPIFAGDQLIAWTANIAHNSDVGGMAPGSLSGEATEIFQEGLRLPAVKIIREGELDEAVMDIITINSRMPDFLKGDVWAAIASVRVGARRLEGLAAKYGVDTFLRAMNHFMDFGERAARAELAKLPHGSFELSEEQDDGRIFNVKVTISDDEFLVDLRDNPDQDTGPTNANRDGTMICAQMVFKALTDPDSPANDGSFRPLKVLTREGSIFDAREGSAIGFYFETEVRTYDLIWRCLAPHIPERLPAGHFSSICGTFIGGIHPDTGRQYTIVEPQIGGWGAWEGRDGNPCIFSGFHGETYNTPAEISEARNGLYVDRMALNTAPGGEGQFNGGRGLILEYRIRTENGFLTAGYTRSRIKPWSLEGGEEGSGNFVEVIKADGNAETHSFVSGMALTTDDVVRVITSSGAGYGDPKARDPEAVRRDVKNGLITAERAATIHGVTV